MDSTTEERSRIMRAVKGQNTAPEMTVRRLLHAMGFRYRLHAKELPGKPDIVFCKKKKAIFVHGCFWHGHGCIRGKRIPKTNQEYWVAKIQRNVERDQKAVSILIQENWQVLTIWECELKNNDHLEEQLKRFMLA
jgi:DNA mismatch endonuclease (patch repair protein)